MVVIGGTTLVTVSIDVDPGMTTVEAGKVIVVRLPGRVVTEPGRVVTEPGAVEKKVVVLIIVVRLPESEVVVV